MSSLDNKQENIVPNKRMRYYTSNEVSEHNSENDCWLSFLGKVVDITPLLAKNKGLLSQPLIKFAGQDISHWFDISTQDLKTYIEPGSELRVPYLPNGRIIHVPPNYPSTDWTQDFDLAWWQDPQYVIGLLSRKSRYIRVINTLTGQDHKLEVCSEETLREIRNRYLQYNKHTESYTWKRLGNVLELDRTLEENGIPDESVEYEDLGLDENIYIPVIHLYFNDDLTSS